LLFTRDAGSLSKNTQLMANITREPRRRAIVIEADCNAGENRVEPGSARTVTLAIGSKQVCSEQIHFCSRQLYDLLPSMVFRIWIPTCILPLWQQEFREPMDPATLDIGSIDHL